jgi:hypothetical protein
MVLQVLLHVVQQKATATGFVLWMGGVCAMREIESRTDNAVYVLPPARSIRRVSLVKCRMADDAGPLSGRLKMQNAGAVMPNAAM